MNPDKPKKPTDEDRRQLLEEIRRRAEEAELHRIEEEEKVERIREISCRMA